MKYRDNLPVVLDIDTLSMTYRNGELTPGRLVEILWQRLEQTSEQNIWITCLGREQMLEYARALEVCSPDQLPLYGIPFAIKDNIDLAGLPTTAACPNYAYDPEQSAYVVQLLLAAGALPVGKTNMDQFATGLVGTRSPYGVCKNSFNQQYIAGGSSSGSAVAVARGLVSFSLGTDTAGSGRVPAAFNNLVGIKPTRGVLSTSGVVPACRSLDCVSIFALNARDAERVWQVTFVYDDTDAYARRNEQHPVRSDFTQQFHFGVPLPEQLQFFGDTAAEMLFASSVKQLQDMGGQPIEVDIQVLLDVAALLYAGPWLAERYGVARDLLSLDPDTVWPVTRSILASGAGLSMVDAWDVFHPLQELKRDAEKVWQQIDVLLTPTTGTIYRVDEIEADPVGLNNRLGHYTNFMNLLDLSAVALPAGFHGNGLPFGITLCAPAFFDHALLALAKRREMLQPHTLGIGDRSHVANREPESIEMHGYTRVAVCGAHLSGLHLNRLLTERSGRLLKTTRTASAYRLYALPDGKRPGMVRCDSGAAIEVELWALPLTIYGEFVAEIPPPLGIGTIDLQDGTQVQGFVCEAYAVRDAVDITSFGGWREYLARPT